MAEAHEWAEKRDELNAMARKKIEEAVKNLKDAIAGDSLETINTAKEVLTTASHHLAEEMYKQAQAASGAQAGAEAEAGTAGAGEDEEKKDKGEGAVDADFEVVDDDKK